MKQEATLIRARLKTPRAAAIAGILFSVLLITGLLLFRLSVRADPLETGAWGASSNQVIFRNSEQIEKGTGRIREDDEPIGEGYNGKVFHARRTTSSSTIPPSPAPCASASKNTLRGRIGSLRRQWRPGRFHANCGTTSLPRLGLCSERLRKGLRCRALLHPNAVLAVGCTSSGEVVAQERGFCVRRTFKWQILLVCVEPIVAS
jgi:hypothetical protein